MSTVRREIFWACAVLSQLVAIFLLGLLSNALGSLHLLDDFDCMKGDMVMFPALLAVFLAPPILAGILLVWAWQFLRPPGRPPRPAAFLLHGAAGVLGSIGSYTGISWMEGGLDELSPWILLPTMPLGMLASMILYLPRFVLPRLRAQEGPTSLTSGVPAR